MLTYAGIPLSLATSPVALAIERAISPRDVVSFEETTWPGRNRLGWTVPGYLPSRPPVRAGVLHWPRDASRFAVGYFLASDNQLSQIRSLLATQGYTRQPLVMSQEDQTRQTVQSITASLWMLPPRPLFQITGHNGLYLLTLVDDRYFWAARDANFDVDMPESWSELMNAIATSLNVTLTADAITGAYLSAPKDLISHYESPSMLLDAVAYNTGLRIVANLDGSIVAQDPVTAAASLRAQLNHPVMGGGAFAFQQAAPFDLSALLPASVTVTFSPVRYTTPTCDPYVVVVTLASLALPELAGIAGHSGSKTFHDSALPAYSDGGALLNGAELTALATQIATDWYRFQLADRDVKFAGIVPWQPEGLSDCVEWTYRKNEVSTRVQRPAWDDRTEELLHAGTYGSNFDLTPSAAVRVPPNAAISPEGYLSGFVQVRDDAGELVDGAPVWVQDLNS